MGQRHIGKRIADVVQIVEDGDMSGDVTSFAPWAKARLFYDSSTGTGTLNAISVAKE